MLCRACRVCGNLSTLCEPASKVLEFPLQPLHIAYTGAAICVGKPLPFLTGMRSTHRCEKANLLAIPHHWRKQWNTWIAHLNDRFDRKALQPLWGHVHVHTLDLEYFVWIWSTWIDYVNLTILGDIPRMVVHAQAVDTRPSLLLPCCLGTRLYSEQTQAAVLNP